MKQLLYFVFFIQFSAFSQCDSSDVVIPDVDAEFPGGAAKMLKFVQENIEYPPIERCSLGQLTTFYVKFIICEDGTISNVSCERCSGTDIDQNAIDLINKMPKWIPASVNGKPVASIVRLPIHIDLR